MAFQLSSLPPSVRADFVKIQATPVLWPAVVQQAVKAGIEDVSELTDIVFYLHHPERVGRPLECSETKLVKEWKAFRSLIAPGIPDLPKPDEPGG